MVEEYGVERLSSRRSLWSLLVEVTEAAGYRCARLGYTLIGLQVDFLTF